MTTEKKTKTAVKPKVATKKKAAKKVKEQGGEVVNLQKLNTKRVVVSLWGTSPLIMHKWSEKAKKQMLDKQMKIATQGREAKDPERDFRESIHMDEHGLPVFPSVGVKASAVDAAKALNFMKTNLRQAFHINDEYVPIFGSEPAMREDMVRIQQTSDIRYRAEFKTWATTFECVLNVNLLSVDQLFNLFDAAGFGIGLGEWRPAKNGQMGRYQIATNEQHEQIEEWAAEREALVEKLKKDKKKAA